MQAGGEGISRRKAFLLLRYTLIIAMAYLLLVEHEFASPPTGLILAIVAALASNVVIAQLPQRVTDSTSFYGGIIVGDTLWITAALLSSGIFGPEFFYLYFFVLFLAGIGENLALIAVGAVVVSLAYIFVLSTTDGFAALWSSRLLIRIPFLFTTAVFYGYLVDRVRRERQHAREQTDTVVWLEELRQKLADRAVQLEQANKELEREIADRKRAEEALQAAKDYAENLIESSLDMIISTNENRQIVEFNRAAEEAFGYTKQEVVEKPAEVLYADPTETAKIRNALINHGRFVGEVRNKRKNGEAFRSHLSVSVIRQGNIAVGTIGISRDITAQKRVEDQLRKLSLTVEQSPDIVIITDASGTIEYVNPKFTEVTGYTPEEVIRHNPRMLKSGLTRHEEYESLWNTILSGNQWRGELHNKRKNGELYWASAAISPIKNSEGIITHFVGIQQDITVQKKADQALRESEERFRKIFEDGPLGMAIVNSEYRFVKVNSALCRMVGYPENELTRMTFQEITHPEDIAKDLFLSEKVFKGEMADFQLEKRYITKNEEILWVALTATVIRDEHGKPLYGLAMVQDITERKRIEEELQATQLQLIQSAKFESVGQLAAGVAHEVKNPLAIILQGVTFLSRLGLPIGNDNNVGLVLEKMRDAVTRADRVVKGLLDFSSPSAPEMVQAALNPVVEHALSLVQHELIKAHVTAVTELGEDLPPLKLNRNKIEQVFVNLFVNAVQAMPNGGTLTVRTAAKRGSRFAPVVGGRKTDLRRPGHTFVVVEIEDTGPGIPEDKLDRVFDPFFTTKPVGQGTGLGLPVTRKILELHGATIDIRNRQAGGVRVTLTFIDGGSGDDAETTISKNQPSRNAGE